SAHQCPESEGPPMRTPRGRAAQVPGCCSVAWPRLLRWAVTITATRPTAHPTTMPTAGNATGIGVTKYKGSNSQKMFLNVTMVHTEPSPKLSRTTARRSPQPAVLRNGTRLPGNTARATTNRTKYGVANHSVRGISSSRAVGATNEDHGRVGLPCACKYSFTPAPVAHGRSAPTLATRPKIQRSSLRIAFFGSQRLHQGRPD